jgi:hypothetical protein
LKKMLICTNRRKEEKKRTNEPIEMNASSTTSQCLDLRSRHQRLVKSQLKVATAMVALQTSFDKFVTKNERTNEIHTAEYFSFVQIIRKTTMMDDDDDDDESIPVPRR